MSDGARRRSYSGRVHRRVVVASAWLGCAAALGGFAAPPSTTAPGSPPLPLGLEAQPAITAADVPATAPAFDPLSYSIDDPTSPWVVTNKTRPVTPVDYTPPDLTALAGIPYGAGETLRADAAAALHQLYDAATDAQLSFRIESGYRSYNSQVGSYWHWRRFNGRWSADRASARPGFSEHQTGWAVDIFDGEACRLQHCFGRSGIGLWVSEHGWEYGFIVRYPEDATATTGFTWEPWHLRFVGIELATEMHVRGVATLEDFFGLPAAPNYL